MQPERVGPCAHSSVDVRAIVTVFLAVRHMIGL